jgi:hypothetical protein
VDSTVLRRSDRGGYTHVVLANDRRKTSRIDAAILLEWVVFLVVVAWCIVALVLV